MAARYAKGRRAWGECARSGKRLKRKDMVEDGYVPGLLVAPDWHDGPHPLDKPIRFDDPVAIRRPAPRRDKSQDSYGPDERFDDEQLMTKPHLVASLSIGPFTIESAEDVADAFVDDIGQFIVDDSGRLLVVDRAVYVFYPAVGLAPGLGSVRGVTMPNYSLGTDNGDLLIDDNGNEMGDIPSVFVSPF